MGELWGQFAEWLRAISSVIPRLRIVRANERGVRYRHGKHVSVVHPGLRCYWPLVTEMDQVCVARQSLDVPPQALEVLDGESTVTVLAGATVVYRIVDVVKYLVDNWDADANVAEVSSATIRAALSSLKFRELMDPGRRDQVDEDLTIAVQADLEHFGIEVESVRLTNFARAVVSAWAIVGRASSHQGSHALPIPLE